MSINLKKAEISTELGINNKFLNHKIKRMHGAKIDAIFIPTIGVRDSLKILVNELKKYTPNIILLMTANSANIEKLYEDVEIITFTKKDHSLFLASYSSSQNPSLSFISDYDIPTKRNFAIEYAKFKGYKRIGLIDDDIFITKDQIMRAAYFLSHHANIVGFYSLLFPDKSVIGLIEAHLKQISPSVALSGNCLFFDIEKTEGFFPYVYNEDWIFIIRNLIKQEVLGIGIVKHGYHEPWKNLNRIKFEQFGNIIARGIRHCDISNMRAIPDTISYWNDTYKSYYEWLEELLKLSIQSNSFTTQIDTAIEALKAFNGREISEFIQTLNREDTKTFNETIFSYKYN